MGVIENILAFLSPQRALQAAVIKESKRLFEGATLGRRGSAMPVRGENSPNQDRGQLGLLVNRCRYVYKNNVYAKKAIRTIVLNTIGTGIQAAPRSANIAQNDRIKLVFVKWADSKKCDFYGRKNLYGLQALVMKTVAISGECLVIKRRSATAAPSDIPLQLQVLEADYLNTSMDSYATGTDGGGFVVSGIEFDSEGRRVAYHIYKQNPQDVNGLNLESERILASEVLHIFEEERPGQVRGIPFLAAALLKFSDFDGYEDAQLMRQKIAACFSVFITQSPNPSDFGGGSFSELERVEPGIIERLAPGQQVSFASPPPAEGYSDYTRKIQQGMAAGVGITYEQLAGDLSGVNFSSGRMGWIEAQKQIEDWQYNVIIPDFCQEVWGWFSEIAQIKGVISEYVPADFTPHGRYMIDPVKEVKGTLLELAAGLKPWSEAVRERGYDPESLLKEMRQDKEKLQALGIKFDWLNEPDPTPEN